MHSPQFQPPDMVSRRGQQTPCCRLLSAVCLLFLCALTSGCSALRQVGQERFVAQHMDAAMTALRRNDALAAMAALQQVLKVEPQHREARALARLIPLASTIRAYREGRWREAAALWEQVGLDRLSLDDAFYFADAHDRSGNVRRAEQIYAQLAQRYPDDPNAYNALGYFYAQRDMKLHKSVQLLKKSLRLIPEWNRQQRMRALIPGVSAVSLASEGAVLDSLGWAYYKQGKIELARSTIERARALVPNHPEILYHLGVIYRTLNREDKARRELQQALSLTPDRPESPAIFRALAADIRADLRRLGVTPDRSSDGWRAFVKRLIQAFIF